MCTGAEIFMVAQAGSSIFSAVDDSKRAIEESGKRIGQARFNAELSEEQSRRQASRLRGRTRAAFAKGGVKNFGSAEALQDQQALQDDLEILKIRHDASVFERAEFNVAKKAQRDSTKKLISASADLFGGFGGEKTPQRDARIPVPEGAREINGLPWLGA